MAFSSEAYPIDTAEELIALHLSLPNREKKEPPFRHALIDIRQQEVHVTVPRVQEGGEAQGRIYCSKEGIAWAMLLFEAWRKRGGHERESELAQSVLQLIRGLARVTVEGRSARDSRSWWDADLLGSLRLSREELAEVERSTDRALSSLEAKGLVYDPFVTTTGLVVFAAGLIPVSWSVRTEEGEEVVQEVRISAGLWDYHSRSTAQNENRAREWSFNFRGLKFVRRMLEAAANEVLQQEKQAL